MRVPSKPKSTKRKSTKHIKISENRIFWVSNLINRLNSIFAQLKMSKLVDEYAMIGIVPFDKMHGEINLNALKYLLTDILHLGVFFNPLLNVMRQYTKNSFHLELDFIFR
jgi:hypothetical protein